MTCAEYNHNMTVALSMMNQSHDDDHFTKVNTFFNLIALPVTLIFGLFGNILNLVILTRKSLENTMDLMEKSVHLGLVVLAVSDLSFCVVALPRSFLPAKMLYTSDDSLFLLYYQTYYEAVVNIFIMSSTWLTVVMAVGRYLAICHPLHARGFVDLQSTRAALVVVFIFSVLFNLPMFWRYTVIQQKCAAICICSTLSVTDLFRNATFRHAYFLSGTIVGVFIPVVVLAFSNICLIRALRQSQRMRRRYRANQPSNASSDRLTPTLIAIVVLFFTLTLPSHFFKLVRDMVIWNTGNDYSYHVHITGTVITNFMMAANFAVNFVLYCVINVHFRKTVYRLFCCVQNGQDFFRSQAPTTQVVNMSEPETDV